MLCWPGVKLTYLKGPVPTGFEGLNPTGRTADEILPASVSGKVGIGLGERDRDRVGIDLLDPGCLDAVHERRSDAGTLGVDDPLDVKIKSSAVRSLPLWKVTPLRRRIVHNVAL